MSIGRIVVALLVTVPALLTASQQPPKIGSGTTAVVVDVIVRDARGNPVTDLRKQDFGLLEDGARQEVADLALAGSAARAQDNATPAPSGAPEAGKSSVRPARPPAAITPSFLALVFDRLSLDARVRAYKGALEAVDSLQDGDYVAVYLSDLSLRTSQPYTNDREKLRTALKEVASRPTAVFDRTAMRDIHKSESFGDSHASVPEVASAEFVGRPVDTQGGGPEQHAAPTDVSLGTSGLWEIMARDQQGYATTNALLAVTAALAAVPGRKTVVFFAEGLAIPDAVLPHFRNARGGV